MSDDRYEFEPVEFSLDETPVDDGRAPLALAAGLAAALVAGGIWAALVFAIDMEIGYVAWGVGLLVGWAMGRMTILRTRQLALAAAAFAILGLATGKAIIFAGSTGAIAADLEQNDEMMQAAIAWVMYEERELDDTILTSVDAAMAAGDTLSDAVWAQMTDQAAVKLAGMTPEQRSEAALAFSRAFQRNFGLFNGILAQLSLFDALWLLLAVGTAYRMLAPPRYAAPAESDLPVST